MANPIKKLGCGPVNVAVWLNTTKKDNEIVGYYSSKFTKSYKDNNTSEWKHTDSFGLEDLPKLALLANEIYKEFRCRSYEVGERENQSGTESIESQTHIDGDASL